MMIDTLHEQDSLLTAMRLLARPKQMITSVILDSVAENLKRVDVPKVAELVRGIKLAAEAQKSFVEEHNFVVKRKE